MFYQRGYFFGNDAEEFVALGGFEIDDRAQVNFATTGMGIVHTVQAMLFQNHVEVADEIGQVVYIHTRVFNHGHGFFIAGQVAQQTKTGFAQGPYFFAIIAIQHGEMIAQSGGPHVRFHGGKNGSNVFAVVAQYFYHQNGAGVALYKKAVFALLNIILGAFKYVVVNQFAGAGLVFQRNQVGPQAFIN